MGRYDCDPSSLKTVGFETTCVREFLAWTEVLYALECPYWVEAHDHGVIKVFCKVDKEVWDEISEDFEIIRKQTIKNLMD